jgi:hypothetical protein
MDRLADLLRCETASDHAQYVADAMQPLLQHRAPSVPTALTSDEACNATSGFDLDLQAADAHMSNFGQVHDRSAAPQAAMRLHISHNSRSGQATAYVTLLDMQQQSTELAQALQTANTALAGSAPPPFVLSAEPPSEDQTISLFHLCPEQAFPFRLFARAFLCEKRRAQQRAAGVREEEAPRQLLLIVTGFAGTGKSECAKAFLWFAFQHQHCHLVSVTAYTWKAALLLGNEHNPGYSTSAFFGINAFRPHDITAGAVNIFDADKYLALVDEASLIGKCHFAVSKPELPSVQNPKL